LDFALNEIQHAIRETARQFGDERIAPFAMDWDRKGTIPKNLWIELGALGFGGMFVPESSGGSGLSRLDGTIAFEALSAGCPSVAAFLSIHNMCASMVASYATDPVVRRSEPLQKTVRSKRSRMVNLHPDTAERLGLAQGDPVRISAKDSCVDSALNIDPNLAKGCVRIPIGVPEFSEIGGAEMLHIESAALDRAAEG